MPKIQERLSLQKTIKAGLRRCVYERWEVVVSGKTLTTKTITLERLYRGNTPYPVKTSKVRKRTASTPKNALRIMARMVTSKRNIGFQAY